MCLDILDRFESHANTPNVCGKAHCDVKGSRIPANASVAPDTPARGMKSCADDLLTRKPNRRVRHVHMQCIVNHLRKPANTSGSVGTPQNDCEKLNSPGTNAGKDRDARERLMWVDTRVGGARRVVLMTNAGRDTNDGGCKLVGRSWLAVVLDLANGCWWLVKRKQ